MRYNKHNNTHKQQHGSVLVVALILLGILSLLASSALRTAIAETRLINALLVAGSTFELAELGIASGLRLAVQAPAELPVTEPIVLPPLQADVFGRVETSVMPTGVDNLCPELAPLDAERLHYEIHATAVTDNPVNGTHVQGFYICRELCTAACIGAESMPVKSYWTMHDTL
jgi:type II secretory pathway pseudopilin PulG